MSRAALTQVDVIHRDFYSDEDLLAFELAEDARLRFIGIDPNNDPVVIMTELKRRAEEYRKRDEADDTASESEPA